MTDHDLFIGNDMFTGRQYLLRVWHGGGAEIAYRDDESHSWSPPVDVVAVPAEVSA